MAVPLPTRMRRLMPWILWSSGGLSVIGIAFVIMWLWLPRWAPEWVVKHSPWVDPVLRAVVADELPLCSGEFSDRMVSWGPSALPVLIAGLDSSDDRYRMVAVAAFWPHGASQMLPQTPEVVREKIRNMAILDDSPDVRMCAFLVLSDERSSHMSEIRSRGMRDPADGVRYVVIPGVDSTFSLLDWETLLHALSDEDAEVRSRAIRRADDLGETRAIPRLMEMAREERDENFRHVLWALGRLKATAAIPLLNEFLKESQTRHHAGPIFLVLAQIGLAEGFRAKVESLRSDDVALRAFAARELGTAGDPHAIEPLTRQLQDPEPLVLGHVVIALCRLKAFSAVESILDLLEARGAELMTVERGQEVAIPIVSGRLMQFHFSEVVDQVATMPLTSEQRERLERLREE